MAKTKTLEQIDASLSRWKTRLRRAMTAVDKLEKQRKRLAKTAAPKLTQAEEIAEPVLRKIAGMPKDEGAVLVAAVDTSIPSFLRRTPDPVTEAIRNEQAETKKKKAAGRIAKMKAKQSGELRKMPLTGKAALAAIRG